MNINIKATSYALYSFMPGEMFTLTENSTEVFMVETQNGDDLTMTVTYKGTALKMAQGTQVYPEKVKELLTNMVQGDTFLYEGSAYMVISWKTDVATCVDLKSGAITKIKNDEGQDMVLYVSRALLEY